MTDKTGKKKTEPKKRPSVKTSGRVAKPASGQTGKLKPAPEKAAKPTPRTGQTGKLKAVEGGASKQDEAAAAAEAPQEQQNGTAKKKRPAVRKKAGLPRWLSVALAVLAVAVVLLGAVFSWDRWLRYNDAADFQGTWYVPGTEVPVTISQTTVTLTPDVSYEYQVDDGAKTITFTFTDLSSHGRYRFSADRTQLAIIEGEGYGWFTTLCDDLAHSVQCAINAVQGVPEPALGEGTSATLLVRDPAQLTAATEAEAAAEGEAPAAEGEAPAENAAAAGTAAEGTADAGA